MLHERPEAAPCEVQRLYTALFRKPLPDILRVRFCEVSQRVFAVVPEAQHALYTTALARVEDLEALEIAGRYTGKLPLLSAKMTLLIYLTETLPDHQHHYVNEHSSGFLGLLTIVQGGLKTLWKLVKGLYLLRTTPCVRSLSSALVPLVSLPPSDVSNGA